MVLRGVGTMRMHVKRLGCLGAASALLLAGGCEPRVSDPGIVTDRTEPPPLALDLEGVDARMAGGYTGFSFDLFRSLVEGDPAGNVFISGTSIAFALAMTWHGTGGETRAELSRALGVEGMTLGEFNASNAAWLAALVDDPGDTELAIANSVWVRLGFPFQDGFLERNREYYRATVEAADFDDPATVERINAWVSEQTRGRIDEIVEAIDPEDIFFLINAVYFLGEWTTPFSEDATAPGTFTGPEGEGIPIPFMVRRDTLEYHRADGYQAVRLPYGDDGRFAMYVFLPDLDSDLEAFYRDLDTREWERRIGRLAPTDVELEIPRFTLEYEIQLIPILRGLGIERAFVARLADFSPMTGARDDVYISEVLHKTFVQVNETGTEAAGVTSVRGGIVSVPRHPRMVVNRPFFFVLRDDATGTVLFQGQITRPDDPVWEGSGDG
jgi:serine protease inhibitor